ncbi:hypothetical protein ACFFTM_07240 [Pseudoduganella plicata]|uniref:Uncharacterized protein n=1 Tax=Pseudoduganella plicata TaxID=321984 RepID=A0A4P7BKZ7_9BURK|nr:hypothetical protein [Pseudoduganella plicata]QBQ38385.1 hypothetical protein E1742_21065 [Pseudoduganella plicata]GGY81668.1 hypothetical protein GCM10007388_13110 [Pseudoduganella plicata]
MKKLTLLALLASGAVHAAEVPAAADCIKPALPLLIHELPLDIQQLLGRGRPGIGGLADSNERFSATDALSKNPAPMTRFRWAGQGDGCYAVTLERGGFIRYVETAVLRQTDGAWRIVGTRVPNPEETGTPYRGPTAEDDVWESVDLSKWQKPVIAK